MFIARSSGLLQLGRLCTSLPKFDRSMLISNVSCFMHAVNALNSLSMSRSGPKVAFKNKPRGYNLQNAKLSFNVGHTLPNGLAKREI